MSADFLHHGHINLLQKAKKYGNIIIGLMTDDGIKSYKKKSPYFTYKLRKKVLKEIKCIKKIRMEYEIWWKWRPQILPISLNKF